MVKIIGISGRKQAGKNTVANFIHGDILKSMGMILDFKIQESGKLHIQTKNSIGEIGWGIFDTLRRDSDFVHYARENMWPYVKTYHFADYLKKICVELFGLSPSQVYGTDEEKNTDTEYGMSARSFLQYLGTDVMRKIKDDIWVESTVKIILQENPLVALVPDVRFPNEVEAIHQSGGVVLRLTRDVYSSDHKCETALDEDVFDWNNFDYIIENSNKTLENLTTILETLTDIWR